MTDNRREKEVGSAEGFLLAWTGVRIAEGLSIDMHEHETRLALSEALVDAGFGSAERFEIEQRSWSRIFDIKLIQYPTEKEKK